MAGELIAQDGQYQFTHPDGKTVLMGAGTPIRVLTVEGLLSLPEVKHKDVERDNAEGLWFQGPDYMSGRRLTMELAFDYSQGELAEQALDEFHSAFQTSSEMGVLVMQRRGKNKRRMECRVRRSAFLGDYDLSLGLARGGVELMARDPRVYSDEFITTQIDIEAVEFTGREYPREYLLTYGDEVGSSGTAVLVNEGNFESPPLLRVYGPVINPKIAHTQQDKFMRLETTLSSTDIVEIDMDMHSVVLNDDTIIRDKVDPMSDWWTLDPDTNEIKYTGEAGTGSRIEVDWRHAWATG